MEGKNDRKVCDQFALSHDRLASAGDDCEAEPIFKTCLNAHGMYETMRFVLCLSPRTHELTERIESNEFETSAVPADVIQAYSTYIHETIHWWQHVGSTSGLLFSLSYFAQCHSSMGELKEVLAKICANKLLKGYTDQILLKEGHSAQANTAVNNALDVEYYKYYAYEPRKHIHWLIKENHRERSLSYAPRAEHNPIGIPTEIALLREYQVLLRSYGGNRSVYRRGVPCLHFRRSPSSVETCVH